MIEKTVNAPTKPPRSPIERAFVWGVIGVGLLVVGLEAKAHFEHSSAIGKLAAKLQAYETGEQDGGLTKDDVLLVVGGREPVSEPLLPGSTGIMASKLDIYDFKGLMRTRHLYVYYGIEGKQGQPAEIMVVGSGPVETLEEAMAKMPPPAAPSETGATGAGPTGMPGGMAGPGGPGGPGAGGGRRRRGADGGAPGADGAAGRPAADGADSKKDAGSDKKDADAKPDVKQDEAKVEEAKPEEPKKEEPKAEEVKKDS
jgi:hypothetical protein